MSDILLQYLHDRYKNKDFEKKKNDEYKGTVITISRQCACSAIDIARELSAMLKEKTSKEWPVISKEILEESSALLKFDSASDLDYIFRDEPKGVMDDILSAFSKKYYYSDKKIRKTIYTVIKKYAQKGNCIIVGRGGVALTKDMDFAFNIKLQASMKWRINEMQKVYSLSNAEMQKFIVDVDSKREHLRNNFNGGELPLSAYDIIFNMEGLCNVDLAELCFSVLEQKNMLK